MARIKRTVRKPVPSKRENNRIKPTVKKVTIVNEVVPRGRYKAPDDGKKDLFSGIYEVSKLNRTQKSKAVKNFITRERVALNKKYQNSFRQDKARFNASVAAAGEEYIREPSPGTYKIWLALMKRSQYRRNTTILPFTREIEVPGKPLKISALIEHVTKNSIFSGIVYKGELDFMTYEERHDSVISMEKHGVYLMISDSEDRHMSISPEQYFNLDGVLRNETAQLESDAETYNTQTFFPGVVKVEVRKALVTENERGEVLSTTTTLTRDRLLEAARNKELKKAKVAKAKARAKKFDFCNRKPNRDREMPGILEPLLTRYQIYDSKIEGEITGCFIHALTLAIAGEHGTYETIRMGVVAACHEFINPITGMITKGKDILKVAKKLKITIVLDCHTSQLTNVVETKTYNEGSKFTVNLASFAGHCIINEDLPVRIPKKDLDIAVEKGEKRDLLTSIHLLKAIYRSPMFMDRDPETDDTYYDKAKQHHFSRNEFSEQDMVSHNLERCNMFDPVPHTCKGDGCGFLENPIDFDNTVKQREATKKEEQNLRIVASRAAYNLEQENIREKEQLIYDNCRECQNTKLSDKDSTEMGPSCDKHVAKKEKKDAKQRIEKDKLDKASSLGEKKSAMRAKYSTEYHYAADSETFREPVIIKKKKGNKTVEVPINRVSTYGFGAVNMYSEEEPALFFGADSFTYFVHYMSKLIKTVTDRIPDEAIVPFLRANSKLKDLSPNKISAIKTDVFIKITLNFHNMRFDKAAILNESCVHSIDDKCYIPRKMMTLRVCDLVGFCEGKPKEAHKLEDMKLWFNTAEDLKFTAKFNVRLVDTLCKIPQPLSKFGDLFNLKKGKCRYPYDFFTEDNLLAYDLLEPVAVSRPRVTLSELFMLEGSVSDVFDWGLLDQDHKNEIEGPLSATVTEYVQIYKDLLEDGYSMIVEEKNIRVDLRAFMKHYLLADIVTLKEGVLAFNSLIKEALGVEVSDCLTIGSCAYKITEQFGGFADIKDLRGNLSEKIRSKLVGGMVQLRNGKPSHWKSTNLKEYLEDLDINSLYPYCMSDKFRFPAGNPHYVNQETLDRLVKGKKGAKAYKHLKNIPAVYFIEIKNTPEKAFSMVQNNKRKYCQQLEKGEIVSRACNYFYIKSLEKLQGMVPGVDFEVTSMLLFEGWTLTLGKVIEKLYRLRQIYKLQKNKPMSTLIKLILNNIWGKTGQKTFNTKNKFSRDHEAMIKEMEDPRSPYFACERITETFSKLTGFKEDCLNYISKSHIALYTLDHSKWVLGTHVRSLEKAGAIFMYCDTDSAMVVMTDEIKEKYRAIYMEDYKQDPLATTTMVVDGKVALDKEGKPAQIDILGNMKVDYDAGSATNAHGREAVFVGKKMYCIRVKGTMPDDEEGEESYENLHVRAKGVNRAAINKATADFNEDHEVNVDTTIDLYKHLCIPKVKEEEEIVDNISYRLPVPFDMLAGGGISIEFDGATALYKEQFIRNL